MDICIRIEDLVLRNWALSDKSALSRIGDSEEVEATMNDGFPKPFTEEKARQFIENALKSNDIYLAITMGEAVIGSIGAFFDPEDKSRAIIAYFIGKEYWNCGYASKAVEGMTRYLTTQRATKLISAEPFEANIGSRRVLEKNGFELKAIEPNKNKKGTRLINTCKYEYWAKA